MTDLADYARPVPSEPAAQRGMPRGLSFRIMLLLAAAGVLVGRQIAWHFHSPVSQSTLSSIFSVLTLFFFGLVVHYVIRTLPPVPSLFGFNGRLIVFGIWVVLLTVWGLARDAIPNFAFKEAIIFFVFIFSMYVARYDAFWEALRKPAVVLFYVAFVATLLTYRIPGAITTFEGSVAAESQYLPRNLDTIGYSLRVIIDFGCMLSAWGLVTARRDVWRWLQIGTLPAYCFANILLFEFRGAVVLVAAMLFCYAVLLPSVRRRMPIGTMVIIAVMGIVGFVLASRTPEYQDLTRRFQREQIFSHRFEENSAFFRDMNVVDLAVGRGMGGWYHGPNWGAGIYYHNEYRWSANHFGFMGFVLRGGFMLLAFLLLFAAPMLLARGSRWYLSEYNLAAFVVAPVVLINLLLNPILFIPDFFFDVLMAGMCFARFSTPPTESESWPQPTHQETYEYSSY